MNSNLQVICDVLYKRTFPPSLEFQARDLALAPCVGASCHGGRLACPICVGSLVSPQWTDAFSSFPTLPADSGCQ